MCVFAHTHVYRFQGSAMRPCWLCLTLFGHSLRKVDTWEEWHTGGVKLLNDTLQAKTPRPQNGDSETPAEISAAPSMFNHMTQVCERESRRRTPCPTNATECVSLRRRASIFLFSSCFAKFFKCSMTCQRISTSTSTLRWVPAQDHGTRKLRDWQLTELLCWVLSCLFCAVH